ncbi:hypothetical protein DRJ17_03895 [Candidatus Woesearchaeota archaeon]|nr:MAG: hypothetical protein DRJ17_03895 [Candidatus Woesearchaeota archaeon]
MKKIVFWHYIALIALLSLSAFFSSAETAMFSISTLKLQHLVEKNERGAQIILNLRKKSHKLLITILIGNNLVNISASALASVVAIELFGSKGLGLAIGVLTFLILVFGEIMPKGYATKNNVKLALRYAPIFRVLVILLTPFVWILDVITRLFTGKSTGKPSVTTEELKSIIRVGEKEGAIKARERDMIYKIFRFTDIEVKTIMTHRTNIVAMDVNLKLKQILQIIEDSGYSRLPIYEDRIDNIIGIIYVKDILKQFGTKRKQKKFNIRKLLRPAYFIPESKNVDDLLREMQKKKTHIAIVVDEYGGVSGVVTLEDVIEELVGEIYDETDIPERHIRKIKENTFSISGNTTIDNVNESLKINLPKRAGIDTVAGLVLDDIGRMPKKGDVITFRNVRIQVMKTIGLQITKLKITKKAKKAIKTIS